MTMRTLFNRTPLLDSADAERTRQEIRDYFHATCDRYEQLFDMLASVVCPADDQPGVIGRVI